MTNERSNAEIKAHSIIRVIDAAVNHVVISDAELPSQVFQREDVISAIRKAVQRGVEFQILIGPDPDTNCTFIFEEMTDSTFVLKEKPTLCFVVVDALHTRYQRSFGENEEIIAESSS